MMDKGNISGRSRKVAKNTLLLYVRMLLLMLIGLFTSRIVLKTLGVEDYGTYNVVYSVIMMFTVLSNSISGSINRFLAFELGSGDAARLKKVFSSAIIIQVGMCVLLLVLAETLGLWYFNNHLEIPQGRDTAAMWVFQSSIVLLAVQLMSLPFNCTIIAHEDMQAFAWISLLEGLMKLAVAFCLFFSGFDKLKLYAVLMVAVALTIRVTYAVYCKRRYAETEGRPVYDPETIKSMLSLGAWSFTAQGVGVFNTQGVNLLSNTFFGVRINAVRGIAGQIENLTRQFVANFLTALNPLITKTWAENNRDYCFALIRKGCKFSYLITLLIALPFIFESDFILKLWLGDVPDGAALFTTLAILCVMADMMSNSLAQLVISNGKVAIFYTVTSIISALTFVGSYLAFRSGLPAESSYVIAACVFAAIALARLVIARRLCGFPLLPFVREALVPQLVTTAGALALSWLPRHFIPSDGAVKSLTCIACALVSVCLMTWLTALTPGEKAYFVEHLRRRK